MTQSQLTKVVIGVVVTAAVIGGLVYVKNRKEKDAVAKAAASTAPKTT